jgi:plastocyanin
MKRPGLIIGIIVVIVAVGGVIFAMNHKPDTATMNMNAKNNPSSSPAQSTDKVTISNFAFSPANITVKKGTTVTWTNQDSVGHTVTETDSQTGPASSTLSKGQSYSFTFNAAGTFKYDCSIHPYMTGIVTVTD